MSKKKIFSFLVVILFVMSLALSLNFLTVRAEHDCCGDGCQICAVLQVADDISGGGKKAEPPVTVASQIFTYAETAAVGELPETVIAESPVSRCDILTI